MKIAKVLQFTPVMANAGSAYSANDQVGLVNTVANAAKNSGGPVKLVSAVVFDKATQKLALDLLFFDQLPVITSVDNAALAITDAEAAKCIGCVSFVAGDYANTGANSAVATKSNLQLQLQAAAKATNLYCIVVTRGAPTYASGDLIVKLGVEQE